ncbi:MAG: hypothetical protein ACFE94_09840 [Candidatus Hodarchaeota archaeon]
MKFLKVPKPISCGLILSYKCSVECKHCMYFGSPKWKEYINEKTLCDVLTYLSEIIEPSPYGPENVSLNYGLHFTGGEPFLNFPILLKAVKIGKNLNIPSTFVETNCFWCKNDDITGEKLFKLKNQGLHGILISVNPFILENIPFEYTKRAIRMSMEIFRENFMIYQIYYFNQFQELNIKEKLSIEDYLKYVNIKDLKRNVELFKMGRAAYSLQNFYTKFPIKHFFNENCSKELLRNWHCHVDLYGNYMPGYCGGISWGNIENIDLLVSKGINLEDHPVLKILIFGNFEQFYNFAMDNYNYLELEEGYVSKCHVCLDIRKKIASKTDDFKELNPIEFYNHF